jgi:Rrf2 family nitric oxide-sensitive transcriptional repressor
MKLTSYTNYALRALQLAALRAPQLVRVDDVVAVHGLARPHIVKIVHELGKAGFLETVRGRNGGFRLARPAEAIVVGETWCASPKAGSTLSSVSIRIRTLVR